MGSGKVALKINTYSLLMNSWSSKKKCKFTWHFMLKLFFLAIPLFVIPQLQGYYTRPAASSCASGGDQPPIISCYRAASASEYTFVRYLIHQDEQLDVQLLSITDFRFIYEIHNDDSSKKFYGTRDGIESEVQAQSIIQRYYLIQKPPYGYFIVTKRNGLSVGMVGLYKNNNDLPELALNIHPNYRNKGYGKLLLQFIINYAYINGWSFIIANIYKNNIFMIKALKSKGFEFQYEEEQIREGKKERIYRYKN